MAKILIPTKAAEDWKQFLADPEKQWKRGYSAMAAALSWEAARGLPDEIRAILGPDSDLLFAIPEHKVPLPGGGRESQCDVFALVRTKNETIALAVEAKVAETFGPTIGEWRRNESPGKIKRLSAICEMLGTSYPPPDHLRYQLFHRSAAAIVEAERFKADRAAMIVQSFSQTSQWFEDFYHFCGLFDLDAKTGCPLIVPLKTGISITLGWAVGSEEFL